MATLVPKTPAQQSKLEVIFVADQSSSMRGARTKTLVAALRVFLKSLPVGIKFNICYFGTYHSFLFAEGQAYNQTSLEKALKSLDELDGKHGGTKTLDAIRASVNSRDNAQPLSIILATDGDIWQQQELFDYINDSVATSRKTLRVFALGVGNSVSSTLIEGVARAGNGFAQSVGEGEKLDGKVVRMLRGALTPDHGALTMEIQYQRHDDEDEFVMVERVSDSLRVLELDEDDWPDAQSGKVSAASAETTAGGIKDVEMPDADGQARFNHFPAMSAPKLMQTPQHIPPLYPFSRTNIYVLMSPDAAQGTIRSIVLKGNSVENPFEVEIPIEVSSECGEIIHQLAAKKAVAELEEGRGWLVHAKDEMGVLIKEKYPAHFQSMVEREAVRLGIHYQIAGKFTSFVATETDAETPENNVSCKAGIVEEAETSLPVSNGYRQSQPGGLLQVGGLHSQKSASGQSFGSVSHTPASSGLFGAISQRRASVALLSSSTSTQQSAHKRKSTGGKQPRMQLASKAARKVSSSSADQAQETDALQKIIALQTFEGYWNWDAPLLEVVGLSADHKAPVGVDEGVDSQVWATVLAITFLEAKIAGDKDAWEMVVEKARGWLKDMEEEAFEEKWTLAKKWIIGAE